MVAAALSTGLVLRAHQPAQDPAIEGSPGGRMAASAAVAGRAMTATVPSTVTATATGTLTVTATASAAPTGTVTISPTAATTVTGTPTATHSPSPPPPPAPLALLVDDAGNAGDGVVGDRRCATGADTCTLRAALEEAGALPGGRAARITFARAMTIDVPDGEPLPPIEHADVIVSGRGAAPAAPAASATGEGEGRRRWPDRLLAAARPPRSPQQADQAPDTPRVVLQGMPAGSAPTSGDAGLTIDGGPGSAIEGLTIRHFAVGVRIGSAARVVRIGSDLDGVDDRAEANVIVDNGDGIRIEGGAMGSTIRFNTLRDNLRHGVWIESALTGGHTLTRNMITSNGRAAIAVAARAPELSPPMIERVGAGGFVNGRGCPGCIVEVFADPIDQAARYVDGGSVEVRSDGTWRLAGLAFDATTDVALTATQRDASGSTSRLSEPVAVDPAAVWRLVSAPGPAPGALAPDEPRALERRYRLVDRMGMPVRDATVTFEPFGDRLRFESGGDGAFDVVLPVPLARSVVGGQLHAALSGLERRSGERHAALWRPQLAVAVARPHPAADPGLLSVDLHGLSPEGLGATLFLTPTTPSGPLGATGSLSDAVGAAYRAAPAELREGPFAWHEALARDGGIYHVAGHGIPAGARIEISAPADAYRAAGPASACRPEPLGATIARWDAAESAWSPVATTIVAGPGSGSGSGAGSGPGSGSDPGSVPEAANLFAAMVDLGGERDGAADRRWEATYTVGYDVLGPSISLFVEPEARVERWSAVLGRIEDDAAGVRAVSGVTVTLGGIRMNSRFDPVSGEIVFDASARDLPAEVPPGPAELRVEAVDGFCNASARTVIVRAVHARPSPAPIHLPLAVGRTSGP